MRTAGLGAALAMIAAGEAMRQHEMVVRIRREPDEEPPSEAHEYPEHRPPPKPDQYAVARMDAAAEKRAKRAAKRARANRIN